MKLKKQFLLNLLQEMGVEDAQLVDDTENISEEETPSVDNLVQKLLDSRSSYFLNKFKTETLPSELEKHSGMIGSKLRSQLRKLSGNMLKTQDLEGKTDDQAIEMFYKLISTSKDPDLQILRDEIASLSDKHSGEITKIKGAHNSELSNLRTQYNSVYIKDAIKDALSKSIPKEVKTDTKALADLVYTKLITECSPSYDLSNSKIDLRSKENNELPFMNGSKAHNITDYATNIVNSLGIIPSSSVSLKAGDISKHATTKPNHQDMVPGSSAGSVAYDNNKMAADNMLAEL